MTATTQTHTFNVSDRVRVRELNQTSRSIWNLETEIVALIGTPKSGTVSIRLEGNRTWAIAARELELITETPTVQEGDRVRGRDLLDGNPIEGIVTSIGNKYAQLNGDRKTSVYLESIEILEPASEVKEVPWTYIPNFLSQKHADQWLERSQAEIDWQHNDIRMFGKDIALPRLEAILGDGDYSYSGVTLKAQPWTEEFLALKEWVEKESGYSFQIAIGNQYRDGSDHIGWHSDDSPEMGKEPAIASISLGATRKFQLRHKVTKEIHSFELTHGSLFVMHPGCQEEWQHRICKTAGDVGLRINWTFRPLISTAQNQDCNAHKPEPEPVTTAHSEETVTSFKVGDCPNGVIVPAVLVVTEPREYPYKLPAIARHKVLSETAQQLRLEGIKNQWKDKVYCLPDDHAATEVMRLHSEFQQALDALAAYLRELGHYPTKARELGAIAITKKGGETTYSLVKGKPNPLTPTVIDAYDPASDRGLNLSDWGVYPREASRTKLVRHTPQMLQVMTKVGSEEYQAPTSQHGHFLCPDDAAWDLYLELHNQATNASQSFQSYLKQLGTYTAAALDRRYSDGRTQQITSNQEPVSSQAMSPVGDIIHLDPTPITPNPQEELSHWKGEIDRAIASRHQADQKIWVAAHEINSKRLWELDGHKSFEAFCEATWGWKKSNAWEVCGAGEVVRELLDSGLPESALPTSVSQIRPLKKLAPDLRVQAIQQARESGKLTENTLQAAVETLTAPPPPSPSKYEFTPIEPRQCWIKINDVDWVEGQAVAKNITPMYRVLWGEDRESDVPERNLRWECPVELQESRGSGNSSQAEPAPPVEPDELDPEQKKLLRNLKKLAEQGSNEIYRSLIRMGYSPDSGLVEVSEEIEGAIAEILESHFL